VLLSALMESAPSRVRPRIRQMTIACSAHFFNITSVDLITTSTVSPFSSFMLSALRRVITLSIVFLPTLTTMWAMMSPSVIFVILPLS